MQEKPQDIAHILGSSLIAIKDFCNLILFIFIQFSVIPIRAAEPVLVFPDSASPPWQRSLVAEQHGCPAHHGSSKREPVQVQVQLCRLFATGCEFLGSLATVQPLCAGTCDGVSCIEHVGSVPARHDLKIVPKKKIHIIPARDPKQCENKNKMQCMCDHSM